jgi:hypothetical protein
MMPSHPHSRPSSSQPSNPSATSSSSRDADSESIELADNRDDRSDESQTSGSLADFRDDASSPRESVMFYAALEQERVAASEDAPSFKTATLQVRALPRVGIP